MPLTSRPPLPTDRHRSRVLPRLTGRARAAIIGLTAAALAGPSLASAGPAIAVDVPSAAALPDLATPPAPIAGGRALGALRRAPRAALARGCAHARLRPTPANMPLVAEAIACLVNAHRRAAGLPPLAPSPALYASAQGHSLSMVARDYFSHTGPAGRTPDQRMRAAGYPCHRGCSTGENIAWGSGGYGTASSIVNLWMASGPHRANILRRGFRYQGVGAVVGAPARRWRHRDAVTVTQDLGAAG